MRARIDQISDRIYRISTCIPITAEEMFHATSLGPAVPATYRRLADLGPRRLAIMHDSSYEGDCRAQPATVDHLVEPARRRDR